MSSATHPSARSDGGRRPGPTTTTSVGDARGPAAEVLVSRAGPTAPEDDHARRTVEALERLRSRLEQTQTVLDDYLERLDARAKDARADDARSRTGG